MPTSNVAVTQGSGKNAATYSFVEDAITKDAARAVLSTAGGIELGNSTNPLAISWIGSTAATVGQKTMSNSVPIVVSSDQTTIAVSLDPGHLLGSVTANAGTGTMTVKFDPGYTLGKVDAGAGTFNVALDPGHTLGALSGINTTVNVQLDPGHTLGTVNIGTSAGTLQVFLPDTGHTIGKVDAGAGTFTVKFDPGYTLGKVDAGVGTFNIFIPDTGHTIGKVDAGTGTFTVKFDPGYTLGKVDAGAGTFNIFIPDTGHTLGNIGSLNSVTTTVSVKLDPGYTLGKVDAGAGTFSVMFSPSTPAVLANTSSTIIIPQTASGTASGVSVSGNTIIAPTASRNFKIYAYSITTTAVSSVVARFTNGAGTSPTEFWRVALQAPASVASGANLAIMPPGYLFAAGTGSTLSILIDSGIVFHYSVSYFEESA